MKHKHLFSGFLLAAGLFFAAGCDKIDDTSAAGTFEPGASAEGSGSFEVTFFPGEGQGSPSDTRAAISGPSDRVQTLMYILYRKDASGRYAYVKRETVFRPDNYTVTEMHDWPLAAIRETLPDGDYRVVFLGNLDANLFGGQGQEAVLQNYMTYYEDARIVMPAGGPLAFTDQNMYYFASADFNQNNTQVDILLQRIVTKHEFLRESVDTNQALEQLVDNIAKDIKGKYFITSLLEDQLKDSLLGAVSGVLEGLGVTVITRVVDHLVGALLGDVVDLLNERLLQELLSRLDETLKANTEDEDLLGLTNLLNPWAISPDADVSGYFTSAVDFDLQPIESGSQSVVTWKGIPMQQVAGEELSRKRYLSIILLGGDNRIAKIDVNKEGLVGPLVDGVVDDAALYGRLINIENDLSYTADPNVAYHTNYALLNLTLNNYGNSGEGEPLELTAELNSLLETEGFVENLLGGGILGGLVGGLLLTPLLKAVENVLRVTTVSLKVYLPSLGIQNIVVEGGWEPTTSSLDETL